MIVGNEATKPDERLDPAERQSLWDSCGWTKCPQRLTMAGDPGAICP